MTGRRRRELLNIAPKKSAGPSGEPADIGYPLKRSLVRLFGDLLGALERGGRSVVDRL